MKDSTPTSSQFACENLIDRAIGYGMEGQSVDGTDFLQCLSVIGGAVAKARAGKGPQLVEAKLLRLSGHGEHDDASYVPEDLKNSPSAQDCLEVAKRQLIEKQWATQEMIDTWKAEAVDEIQSAVVTAQKDPKPNPFKEQWTAISSAALRELE